MPEGLNPSAVYPSNLLVEPGNIDLTKRKVVHNPDGTISTEQSIGIGTPKGEAIIPTIDPTGHKMDNQTAVDLYQISGQHMGIYKTPQAADVAATQIHEQQAQRYMDPVSRDFYLQQKTKENDAYQKALESGKQQELDFAKGIPKGIVVGTGAAIGAGLDFLNSILAPTAKSDYQQQATDFLNKALNVTPAQKQGADLGNVTSNFLNVPKESVLIPMFVLKAGMKAKQVEIAGSVYHNIDLAHTAIDSLPIERMLRSGSNAAVPIRDVIKSPEMDKLIPEVLDKVHVNVVDKATLQSSGASANVAARMNIAKNPDDSAKSYSIDISKEYYNKISETQLKSVIVHELQHAIQYDFGLSSIGTSPRSVEDRLRRMLKAGNSLSQYSDAYIKTAAHTLYVKNKGEQEAVLAERLATGFAPLPDNRPELTWAEDSVTSLRKAWDAYVGNLPPK